MLPNTTDPRWEQQDRPALATDIPAALPGTQVRFDNAAGDAGTQQSQAAADLAGGDCVLLVTPVDPVAARQIVSAAAAKKVPVIAYEDMIDSAGTADFVGFDAAAVGRLQGQYVVDHYMNFGVGAPRNVALISAGQTDPLVLTERAGEVSVLQPVIDSGRLRKIYDQFTPGADPATAATEMQGALVANNQNVQVVAVGNDALADAVVGVLVQQGLSGRVLVTGSGATLTALRNVLLGTQTMTVETNPATSARAAASLIGAVLHGGASSAAVNGQVHTSDGGSVPAVLQTPVAVDRSNIAATVIADGSVSKAQLCVGIVPGTAGVC